MNYITSVAKFFDQPLVKAKITKTAPKVLIGGSALYAVHDSFKDRQYNKGSKKKRFIKNITTLTGTVAAALISTFGLKRKGKQIIPSLIEVIKPDDAIKTSQRHVKRLKSILTKSTKIDKETKELFKGKRVNELLDKISGSKTHLKRSEVQELHDLIGKNKLGKKLFNKLIPVPKAIKSKKMFSKIGQLSALGAVPVMGGILGGTVGDSLTDKQWKPKFKNKVKEGLYQVLANIVLCNVGAGAALYGLEQAEKKGLKFASNPVTKVVSMIAGLTLTGIIGGSAIANKIGKTLIDKKPHDKKGLYSERHPEALDMVLHLDDIATVGVLSGLSWIEPVLPIFYTVSGYRAGIGYRNGPVNHKHSHSYNNEHRYDRLKSLGDAHKTQNKAFSRFV